MLVEAAWAAAKAPGPLHAFFFRIRARRGHQVAALAVARKLTVLCWHMLTKQKDYFWARPSLVAHKTRSMELQAGQPQTKGNKRGPAYAYNVKELRDQEMRVAEQAEKHYERFIDAWRSRPPKDWRAGAAFIFKVLVQFGVQYPLRKRLLQIVKQPVSGENLIRIATRKQLVQKFLLDSHVMILSFSSSWPRAQNS